VVESLDIPKRLNEGFSLAYGGVNIHCDAPKISTSETEKGRSLESAEAGVKKGVPE
jgi:hypothetical protein